MLLNVFWSRKAESTASSQARTTKFSSGSGSGASSRSVTSCLEMRALSACSISISRRLLAFIKGAASSTASTVPYSLISCAAPFGPMPGTPGTLSTESPISACTSITLSGVTPNLASTSARPIVVFFIGSSMLTPGRSSCIRSLSEETITVSAPASLAALA